MKGEKGISIKNIPKPSSSKKKILKSFLLNKKMKRKMIHQLNIINYEISFLLNYLRLKGDNLE